MKTLIIFTGGTIGSAAKEGFIGTAAEKKYQLLSQLSGDALHIDTLEPYTILSENLNGSHINMLTKIIREKQPFYDGIIVTHGTDTLQYSAAGTAIALAKPATPVVFVSSNFILDDPRANGFDNLAGAVAFLKTMPSPDVYISYKNAGEHTKIHEALLTLPHTIYDDKIYSLSDNYVGHIENDVFIENALHTLAMSYEARQTAIRLAATNPTYSKESPVLYIKEMPGVTYITPDANIKAVLIETYHSGTLCTTDSGLLSFTESLHKLNITPYLIGVEERMAYESTRVYGKCGLHILPRLSQSTAYMLLWNKG